MEDHLYHLGLMPGGWMPRTRYSSNASLIMKALSTPTALGPSTRYLNAYALVNAVTALASERKKSPDICTLPVGSGFPASGIPMLPGAGYAGRYLLGGYESPDTCRDQFQHIRNSILDHGYRRLLRTKTL